MCRSDDALYRSTVLPVVLKADQRSRDEKCVNWNEAAIRELLTIRAEAEIVRQFSEMVRGALYTSLEMPRVFTGSLRVVCERTHRFWKITGSVNEPKSDHPGTNHGTHFPEWLCERGLIVLHVTRSEKASRGAICKVYSMRKSFFPKNMVHV